MAQRGLLRFVQKLLPARIRHQMIRDAIKIQSKTPDELEIKLASTKEELESAFRILQESYEQMGFAKPNESGMRIIKYFALPTTSIFVAKLGKEVVGTFTIIRQSPMGLPLEKEFDLQKFQTQGLRIAEISSLAIAKAHRAQRGKIFLPVCKYIVTYCDNYLNLDQMVIAINPSWKDFYQGYWLFEPLESKKVSHYEFANGAPAVGLHLDLRTYRSRYERTYGHKKPSHNVFNFVFKTHIAELNFPERIYEASMDPVFTPDLLYYFFRQKSDVFEKMVDHEKLALYNLYPNKEYRHVLPDLNLDEIRSENRYLASPKGLVHAEGMISIIQTLDVSKNGLCLRGNILGLKDFQLRVQVNSQTEAKLRVERCWVDETTQMCGVKIVESDLNWQNYINYLEGQFGQKKMVSA